MSLLPAFNENGYVLMQGLIPHALCELIVRTSHLGPLSSGKDPIEEQESYIIYGSPHGDALLEMVKEAIEPVLEPLYPTYSFFRTYKRGSTLQMHTDRPSCEVSVSIALNQNNWGFDFVDFHGNHKTAHLNAGDGILYQGMHVTHGRKDKLEEYASSHIFLHYVRQGGEYTEFKYDKRERLGV